MPPVILTETYNGSYKQGGFGSRGAQLGFFNVTSGANRQALVVSWNIRHIPRLPTPIPKQGRGRAPFDVHCEFGVGVGHQRVMVPPVVHFSLEVHLMLPRREGFAPQRSHAAMIPIWQGWTDYEREVKGRGSALEYAGRGGPCLVQQLS